MDDRIEKSWKELDFDRVDLNNGNWSWGCGGSPLYSNEWSISEFVEDDKKYVTEIRYKLPACISRMLGLQEKAGREEIRRELRNLMSSEED